MTERQPEKSMSDVAISRCRCGRFDMPDDAMKIEARGYSVHARHKCSWGTRTPNSNLDAAWAPVFAELKRNADRAKAPWWNWKRWLP
jgi:hypothetical protein